MNNSNIERYEDVTMLDIISNLKQGYQEYCFSMAQLQTLGMMGRFQHVHFAYEVHKDNWENEIEYILLIPYKTENPYYELLSREVAKEKIVGYEEINRTDLEEE